MTTRGLIVVALTMLTSTIASDALAADSGDIAEIEGTVIRLDQYATSGGAEINRMLVSRPVIDGVYVRSAYLSACVGPSEEACADAGYQMVEMDGVGLGSRIIADGLITWIWHKRYYDTYYMKAVSDVAPTS